MTKSKAAPSPSPSAPITFRPKPLYDLKKYAKFSQAARHREVVKIVDKFSGNGVHLFVHYVSPILEVRRKALTASGTTRKKYHKSASQLWIILDDEQKFFCDHQAKLIRLGIANGTLGYEQCVEEDVGFRSEWRECVRFSERAVAGYLQIPMPEDLEEVEKSESPDVGCKGEATQETAPAPEVATARAELHAESVLNVNGQPEPQEAALLDTLREPFTAEPRMVHGNFAQLYPFDVRAAEGWQQVSLLRRLADLLDLPERSSSTTMPRRISGRASAQPMWTKRLRAVRTACGCSCRVF